MVARTNLGRLGLKAILVLSLVLAGCGESEDSPAGSPTLAATDQETISLLVQAGATEEEAECISTATADAPDPDANDPEALGRSILQAITELATECASQERLAEIASKTAVLIEEELAGAIEPFIEQFADLYEEAGASPEEARCIAEVFLSQSPETISGGGNAETRAEEISRVLEDQATDCAPAPRLRELTTRAFVSPLVSELRSAGATQKEATCIVDSIESIAVFMPSNDFNGPDSAELAGDRFVENAPGCAPPERLRDIVRTLFKDYQKGCTATSDDPMAPYEC